MRSLVLLILILLSPPPVTGMTCKDALHAVAERQPEGLLRRRSGASPVDAEPPFVRESHEMRQHLAAANLILGKLDAPPVPDLAVSPTTSCFGGGTLCVKYWGKAPHGNTFEVYPDRPGRNLSIAALIHEYGHAVFEHNFNRALDAEALALPWLKPLWEAKRRVEGVIAEREGWILERHQWLKDERENPGRYAPEELWDFENEINRFSKEVADLKAMRLADIDMKIGTALQHNRHPVDFLFLRRTRATVWQTAYEELFSDLYAVLYLKDPAAIAKELADKPLAAQRLRDFSAKIPVLGWRNDKEHEIFAPCRSFIGTHYLGDPRLQGKEELLLGTVFSAIQAELRVPGSHRRNAQQLNQAVIDRLKAALGWP